MNLSDKSALLIIDVQKGFDSPYWGSRNNPDAESKIGELLQAFRKAGRTVLHVQHLSTESQSPLRPGQEGVEFKQIALPQNGEPVFKKTVNSAFIGTDLEAHLRKQGIDTLVIVGLTTPHCVSTSTRMAGNLGFKAYLVSDAVAAFALKGVDGKIISAETIHHVALAELQNEFASIVTTQQILALV